MEEKEGGEGIAGGHERIGDGDVPLHQLQEPGEGVLGVDVVGVPQQFDDDHDLSRDGLDPRAAGVQRGVLRADVRVFWELRVAGDGHGDAGAELVLGGKVGEYSLHGVQDGGDSPPVSLLLGVGVGEHGG